MLVYKQVGTCKFAGKLVVDSPKEDLVAREEIHAHGGVDIRDVAESLPDICGEMKCNYVEISVQVCQVHQ